jgi:hypothetical protein
VAIEMVEDVIAQDVLPVKYITADSLYGNSPEFVDHVSKYIDKAYFPSLPSDTKCWLR